MIDTEKRNRIIDLARAKYIDTGKTRNITEALKLYLEADAGPDEQVPLYITSPEIHQLKDALKQIRPRCDCCDGEMFLQINSRDPEGKIHSTSWQCNKCGIILYSNMTAAEWLKDLQDEARNQNLSGTNEPHAA